MKNKPHRKKESLSEYYARFYFRIGSYLKLPLLAFLIFTLLISFLLLLSEQIPEISYHVYAIETESMEPTLMIGDLVVIKEKNERYEVGDIVSYKSDLSDQKPITHRIIAVEEEGLTRYTTKGDNNEFADPYDKTEKQIIGHLVYTVEDAGNVILFMRSIEGIILLYIIPITILLTLNTQSIYKWLEKKANGVSE